VLPVAVQKEGVRGGDGAEEVQTVRGGGAEEVRGGAVQREEDRGGADEAGQREEEDGEGPNGAD